MAERFAADGWTVAGCGRTEEAIEQLRDRLPEPHLFFPCDVSDAESVAAFAEKVLNSVGAPDLLLNNAATINANAPLWEVTEEEFARVIDVNIKGVHAVLRKFLPSMIERGTGVVVNFSSGWGRSTSPDVAPYCATKWAIEGLTQALSQELPNGQNGLAAVALNPGIIDTDMLRSCFGSGAGAYSNAVEWARTAVPFLQKLSAKDNGAALTAP
ncbi:MAG: NAD(P)-dependent dehydrogenase (short-subunit alcohol dehydrogenase family) [Verrucomicrobiales bacterium]|jgi:NAD(P)-dependent dehydrogenase (short-subunit alcohol dehydrogenase family)